MIEISPAFFLTAEPSRQRRGTIFRYGKRNYGNDFFREYFEISFFLKFLKKSTVHVEYRSIYANIHVHRKHSVKKNCFDVLTLFNWTDLWIKFLFHKFKKLGRSFEIYTYSFDKTWLFLAFSHISLRFSYQKSPKIEGVKNRGERCERLLFC